MTNRPWKLVLLLVGIFVAGGVTGSVATMAWMRAKGPKRPVPEQWGPQRLNHLTKQLELSPEQVEALRPIIRRDVEELAKLRQRSMAETRRVLERMERDIGAQLTPEQKEKFERLNEERRERLRRMLEQRRAEGGKRGERRERPPPDERP